MSFPISRVLASTQFLVDNPQFVFIDDEKLEETAQRYAKDQFEIPEWNFGGYLPGTDERAIQYLTVACAINFAYTDLETKKKFSVKSKYFPTKEFVEGADAMESCLREAVERGEPVLDADYLRHVTATDLAEVFKGINPMPMLEERAACLQSLGDLLRLYDGSAANLVAYGAGRAYDNGNGIVERLTECSGFRDETKIDGKKVFFDKKAQLAVGLMYGRFRNQGLFHIDDAESMTVFADYQVPKTLRVQKVLRYEPGLAHRIDNEIPILANSREEVEIRAGTVHASKRLVDRVNQLRDEPINALHLDPHLWFEGRKYKDAKHHLTKTIAY